MKATDHVRAAVAACVLATACVAVAATRTWTGEAGDGLWATPGNWQEGTAPTDGDSVVIPAGTSGTMNAGDAVRSLAGLTFTQPVGSFTLSGAGLRVAANVTLKMHRNATVTIDCPLEIAANDGKLSISASTNSVLNFKKSVCASTIDATDFVGESLEQAHKTELHFSEPLQYSLLKIAFNNVFCEAANILSPSGVVYFASNGWGALNHGHSLDLCGHDQTIGGLRTDDSSSSYNSGDYWQSRGRNIRSTGGSAALTIRPKTSLTATCRFNDNLSVILDAQGADVVQTFAAREHPMTGSLVVSNGTLRLTTNRTSTCSTTFKNVRGIVIGSTGRLLVAADNGAASPFAGVKTLAVAVGGTVTLDSGSLPAGLDPTKTLSTVTSLGDTLWSGGSGNWETAANWSAGVPTLSTTAAIVGATGGNVVTVDTPVTGAKGLTLESPYGMGAKLTVSSTLPLADALVSLTGDSELEIGAGGCVTNQGVLFTNKGNSTVSDGGKLTIKEGGAFKSIDTSGSFTIGCGGKLTIEKGGLFAFDPGQTNAAIRGALGGELDIRGKLTVKRRFTTGYNTYFSYTGSKVRLSGDGCILSQAALDRTKKAEAAGGYMYIYADDVELSDHATIAADKTLTYYSRLYFYGGTEGKDATLRFRDSSSISNRFFSLYFLPRSKSSLYVDMSQVERGFTENTYSDDSDGNANIGYEIYIGSGKGRVRFDYGGRGFACGNYRFDVGYASGTTAADASDPGSTEFNLMNGANVFHSGYAAIARSSANKYPLDQFYGLRIGSWVSPATGTERLVKGRMTLRDAGTRFTLTSGHAVIGLGRGHGQYVQMDGTTFFGSNCGARIRNETSSGSKTYLDGFAYATNSVCLIGAYGGKGECIVSNGVFTSNLRTFVGGTSPDQYFDGTSFLLGNARTMSNAEGYLGIIGGAYTNAHTVYVGSHGTGTVEIGPRGSFTAQTLVLSNKTASVLSFKLDAANGFRGGASSVKKLVVTDGASLAVDVGDYARRSLTLLTYAQKEGDFAAANIAVTGEKADEYEVRVGADAIRLHHNAGLMIILK